MITADIKIDLTRGHGVQCVKRRDGNVDLVISVAECDVTLVVKPETLLGDEIIQALPNAEG